MSARRQPRSRRARARAFVGTSGYQYGGWRGRFYPEELPQEDWLSFFARHFRTVEINNTFYNLPAAQVFERWRERVGDDFTFAVKFSRFGTHYKHLRDPASTIGLFLERAERLGPKLGPILVQLPPRWKADPERLAAFLAAAPRRLRWVIELRDASWLRADVYAILRRHGAALCIHDLLPRHPRVVTADFLYLRFHGPGEQKYSGGYSSQFLAARAREIRADLRAGRDVYAYFNNDVGGHALDDARNLLRYVERPGSPAGGRRALARGVAR